MNFSKVHIGVDSHCFLKKLSSTFSVAHLSSCAWVSACLLHFFMFVVRNSNQQEVNPMKKGISFLLRGDWRWRIGNAFGSSLVSDWFTHAGETTPELPFWTKIILKVCLWIPAWEWNCLALVLWKALATLVTKTKCCNDLEGIDTTWRHSPVSGHLHLALTASSPLYSQHSMMMPLAWNHSLTWQPVKC